MKDVMLDLETLGTSADAVILSIGAVRFDAYGDQVGPVFYRRVNIDSCQKWGLTVDGRTLVWWLDQDVLARKAIVNEEGDPLEIVLRDLSDFIKEDDRLWGNGAAFDNAILSTAYRKVGIEQPWRFWNDHCFRTMKKLNKHIPAPVFEGIAHHALDDAINQAKHLQAILRSQQIQAAQA
jgi:DNA polymerase III epsilon subunit-like protein